MLYSSRQKESGKIWSQKWWRVILGYSTNSRAYKVFNKRTETVMEPINVVIDDEEVGASNKRKEIQTIPEELPTPLADMVKPSSPT